MTSNTVPTETKPAPSTEALRPLFHRQEYLNRKLDHYCARYINHTTHILEDRAIAEQFCPRMLLAFEQHQRFEVFYLKERIAETLGKLDEVQEQIEQMLEKLRDTWIL